MVLQPTLPSGSRWAQKSGFDSLTIALGISFIIYLCRFNVDPVPRRDRPGPRVFLFLSGLLQQQYVHPFHGRNCLHLKMILFAPEDDIEGIHLCKYEPGGPNPQIPAVGADVLRSFVPRRIAEIFRCNQRSDTSHNEEGSIWRLD